jgi:hypothetical protein
MWYSSGWLALEQVGGGDGSKGGKGKDDGWMGKAKEEE